MIEFPLRVAAIDVGSNAIRFLAGEFETAREWAEMDSIRAPVRLGAAAFRDGELAADRIDDAVAALVAFRRRMDALGIEDYRAAATSAVRESHNGHELVRRAREEAGITLEPITGGEEARLVWLAIRDTYELDDGDWILVDLGGGSVEVSLVTREGVRWTESHYLGTVRLLEELGDAAHGDPARLRRLVEGHIAMLQTTAAAHGAGAAGMIATGGNIEALADIADAPTQRGVRVLPRADLTDLVDRITDLTPAERIEEWGVREDRADVILPAAIVYERIARLSGATDILVPDVGLKEGLLLDLVDDLVSHGGREARLEHEIADGAASIGRRYGFDEAHARQVCRIALSLFDQLAGEHELGESDRRVLIAASLLHDVGQCISYRRHHKHSQYLISNSELPGLTSDEVLRAALVARYHRRAAPKDSHEGFADLSGKDRERVVRSAAILRIADALDREHRQQIREVSASMADGVLHLLASGEGDLFPEQWALHRKAGLFEEAFDAAVRLEVVTLP